MEREMQYFNGERNESVMELEVSVIAPNGLGYGDGSISGKTRVNEVGLDVMQKVESIVNSSDILVPISNDKNGNILDDDGCGDGRVWTRIFEGENERVKSLNRAKVFGGGGTMAMSTLIGLGRAKSNTLRDTFSKAMSEMHDKMIGYGAHTDTHAQGPNCGCGAIDKAPLIVQNAVKFQKEIRGSIEALGIDTKGLDEVEAEFKAYSAEIDGQEYAGADVIKEVADNGKVIKELDDNHKEMLVILNLVDGYTVDQEKVRFTSSSDVQAFAVDVWRVKQIADRLYKTESDDIRHKALLSELVYTLATAATLTKGDLPVYVVNKQSEFIAA